MALEFMASLEDRFPGLVMDVTIRTTGLTEMEIIQAVKDPGFNYHGPSPEIPYHMAVKWVKDVGAPGSSLDLYMNSHQLISEDLLDKVIKKPEDITPPANTKHQHP